MSASVHHPIIARPGAHDLAQVARSDLYALLDKLTTMQSGLMSVWDPDATVHPLTDARRRQARDALQAAIADLMLWIERERPAAEP
ncbi:MAG: hypothetical protein ACHP7M_07165 [Burkholderiales bacterium]|jgi:hypothetical protein